MVNIWNRAAEYGLPHEEVQSMRNDVAEWINVTERAYLYMCSLYKLKWSDKK
ncbi:MULTISPECIES: hypothetical protein [Bacillus cereus group]|uniref:hypothetical protein n=1 Tax=Bacillus cereus group TaxID=86661 RepID=UPI0018F6D44A|nr:hypothetical protein [Bacillus cereus]MBJ7966935.1 hypothetical protein [Bacillus cereus]MBJ8002207.1 hypothetical protein [Bacillus cereus]